MSAYSWLPQMSSTAARQPGGTVLPLSEEIKFRNWADKSGITGYDDPDAHYDMRGYYLAQQAGDPNAVQASNQHFPDTYKLAAHPTFSNESQYANGPAPHWVDNGLLVSPGGQLIKNEATNYGLPKRRFSL